ncbi:hypothetical protein PHJA_001670000 [Phtheirospermum japonicum]|uniref:Uncharacterized protein n=1 Tax=Phtheirospermum japonicum TaxID=374723 RepID=A0A830C3F4_9LAMI|nr:hypothetical protein PHJA_001670000 [Phtheirospermum japonicum]
MAHVLRPLIQWPRWRRSHSTVSRLFSLPSSPPRASTNPPFIAFLSNSNRQAHFRSRALKPRDINSLSDASGSDDESSDGDGTRKSRNAKKRVARRAVRWGMELASFSPPQIKRILRVADLELEVFDALMIVKRLGRDVREGKRRQFNYIGRLLREVEPELMDDLIQATKEGDQSKFQSLAGADILVAEDEEEEEEEEIAEEDEEEESMNINAVTRWYNGLIDKDVIITNEIYSLREVEFDRQELRQLVRKVHSTLEREANLEENGKTDAAAAVNARKALTRFLQGLAKQLPAD